MYGCSSPPVTDHVIRRTWPGNEIEIITTRYGVVLDWLKGNQYNKITITTIPRMIFIVLSS